MQNWWKHFTQASQNVRERYLKSGDMATDNESAVPKEVNQSEDQCANKTPIFPPALVSQSRMALKAKRGKKHTVTFRETVSICPLQCHQSEDVNARVMNEFCKDTKTGSENNATPGTAANPSDVMKTENADLAEGHCGGNSKKGGTTQAPLVSCLKPCCRKSKETGRRCVCFPCMSRRNERRPRNESPSPLRARRANAAQKPPHIHAKLVDHSMPSTSVKSRIRRLSRSPAVRHRAGRNMLGTVALCPMCHCQHTVHRNSRPCKPTAKRTAKGTAAERDESDEEITVKKSRSFRRCFSLTSQHTYNVHDEKLPFSTPKNSRILKRTFSFIKEFANEKACDTIVPTLTKQRRLTVDRENIGAGIRDGKGTQNAKGKAASKPKDLAKAINHMPLPTPSEYPFKPPFVIHQRTTVYKVCDKE